MSWLTTLSFVIKPIKGYNSAGTTQVCPTGIIGNYFYLVCDGPAEQAASFNPLNPPGQLGFGMNNCICTGRIIGFIAYDIVGKQWAFIQTAEYVLTNGTGPTLTNDIGAIKDFIAALSKPPSLQADQVGTLPQEGNEAMCLPIGR
jgi:hypothetical protein